ncbi:MAG: hypothetical protein GC131_02100 [Alphaproteobacteria bacterium]|nr:hypothetical protein [Alphaproteobacteria bacterium]
MNQKSFEILIEFKKVGRIMKVSAIDPATGTEVCIQGPASASKKLLQETAIKKLIYVMNKERKK